MISFCSRAVITTASGSRLLAFSISLKASDTDSVNLLRRPSRLTPPDSTRPSNLTAVRMSSMLSSPLKMSPLRSFWMFSELMPPLSLIWNHIEKRFFVGPDKVLETGAPA